MNKHMPKISIVTPSCNQGEFIEKAIKSVLEQHYPNFEHIIIDNVSTDKTVDILKKYPHLKWVSKPDKGQSDALNKGFEIATGDIIGWLNTDEKYLPNCFFNIRNAFIEHPEGDIFYGDYRWVDEDDNIIQWRKELEFDLFMLKYLRMLHIHTAAAFFKKRVFEQGNYIDVRYQYAMDYDFLLRLALKKYKFIHINAYLSDFKWHKNSKSTLTSHKQFAESDEILLKYDNFLGPLHPFARLIARRFLMVLAHGKRCLLKFLLGHYFTQYTEITIVRH